MQKSKNINISILVILCIYFLFSQFYLQKLGNYFTYLINPLFFILLALLVGFLIKTARKNNGFKKSIIISTLSTVLAYSFFYLLSGVFATYGKNPYNSEVKGIIFNLYSVGLVIFLREYIRYKIINNAGREDNKTFTLIVIVFSLGEIALNVGAQNIKFYYIFKLVFSSVIPMLIKNALFTYIAKYSDYTPAVLYELIYDIVLWLSPVLPKIPWVYSSIMDMLFPLLLLYYVRYDVSRKDKRHIFKMQKSASPKGFTYVSIAVVLIIFFGLGVLPIKPVGIASGSMYPSYNVGDMVLIRKCSAEQVKIGDVIEYRRKDFSVIHRVIDIYMEDGDIFFITKGDNNRLEDSEPVEKDQIVGKAFAKVPYIAYPTVWINLNKNTDNVDVELGN